MIPSAAVFAAAIEDAEGFADHRHADLAVRAVRAPRSATPGGDLMKITGDATSCRPRRQVWDALLDPAVLVAHHPRLRAAGGDRASTPTP